MNLDTARKIIKDENLDFLLVNSTNEFLEEYTCLPENDRYELTDFSGSTGDAVVSKDRIWLFVDGRYHQQAEQEAKSYVKVVKMQIGETFLSSLKNILKKNSVLGINPQKVSQLRFEELEKICIIKHIKSKENQNDIELIKKKQYNCGLKKDEAILVSNLEEISYIFDLRDFSKEFSSKIHFGKAVLTEKNAYLYKNEVIFPKFVEKIYADKTLTNAYDYKKYNALELKTNPIKEKKAIKTKAEIDHLKKAFSLTDKAVLKTRDYINKNSDISEYDIEKELEKNFFELGAKGLSFKPIVAIDENSALAHYSKSSKDVKLKEGSIVLIDCGAYYEKGLATDSTRVFVKGKADKLQKQVYTAVLKSHLKAYYSKAKDGFTIDSQARKLLDKIAPEDFTFGHGLGHGIGISVHEYPPNLSTSKLAKVKIQNNMCFTIEPGLYNPKYFGVRLENSCYMTDDGIKTFSKLPFEKKLIDYDMLTKKEKEQLANFRVI